ncbi:uncharacterized protein [Oscarella lobularis]|uniref:uncharacterized protein n=1 Tax=Oscarella lobularis TaxID=121494 RepID=UPI00331348A6
MAATAQGTTAVAAAAAAAAAASTNQSERRNSPFRFFRRFVLKQVPKQPGTDEVWPLGITGLRPKRSVHSQVQVHDIRDRTPIWLTDPSHETGPGSETTARSSREEIHQPGGSDAPPSFRIAKNPRKKVDYEVVQVNSKLPPPPLYKRILGIKSYREVPVKDRRRETEPLALQVAAAPISVRPQKKTTNDDDAASPFSYPSVLPVPPAFADVKDAFEQKLIEMSRLQRETVSHEKQRRAARQLQRTNSKPNLLTAHHSPPISTCKNSKTLPRRNSTTSLDKCYSNEALPAKKCSLVLQSSSQVSFHSKSKRRGETTTTRPSSAKAKGHAKTSRRKSAN